MKKKISNDIELRSEKVRNLLGEIPPSLVRWGTAIIVAIFLALLFSCLFHTLSSFKRGKYFTTYIDEVSPTKNITHYPLGELCAQSRCLSCSTILKRSFSFGSERFQSPLGTPFKTSFSPPWSRGWIKG